MLVLITHVNLFTCLCKSAAFRLFKKVNGSFKEQKGKSEVD